MKLFARRMIAIKQETTQNTFVAPAAADFLPAHDFSVKPVIEQLSSKIVAPSLGSPANVPGKKSVDIDIKCWGKGPGSGSALGTKYAPLDAIFGACGLAGIASASASVTYTPLNTSSSANYAGPCLTASVVGQYDGVNNEIEGVAGNMKWIIEAGKKWEIEFTGKGRLSSSGSSSGPLASDGGLSGSTGYPGNTVREPVVQNIQFTIDGVGTLLVDKMEIDFGTEVQMIDDISSPNGVYGFTIVDRKPSGSFQAAMVNVAAHDFYGKLENGTVMSGSCQIGVDPGNKFILTLPSIIYSNVQYVNKNGFICVTATMKFNDDPTGATPWITISQQ